MMRDFKYSQMLIGGSIIGYRCCDNARQSAEDDIAAGSKHYLLNNPPSSCAIVLTESVMV
jgi:hypothetical protein